MFFGRNAICTVSDAGLVVVTKTEFCVFFLSVLKLSGQIIHRIQRQQDSVINIIDAPRLHHGFVPDVVFYEANFDPVISAHGYYKTNLILLRRDGGSCTLFPV